VCIAFKFLNLGVDSVEWSGVDDLLIAFPLTPPCPVVLVLLLGADQPLGAVVASV
jgi:hypothetical protein